MGKVLIWGRSAYLGKWRISLLRHSLYDENTGYLFFRNSPLPQISTFSLGQKRCAYYGKRLFRKVLIMSEHST